MAHLPDGARVQIQHVQFPAAVPVPVERRPVAGPRDHGQLVRLADKSKVGRRASSFRSMRCPRGRGGGHGCCLVDRVPTAASSSTVRNSGDRGASAEIGEVVGAGEFRVTSAGHPVTPPRLPAYEARNRGELTGVADAERWYDPGQVKPRTAGAQPALSRLQDRPMFHPAHRWGRAGSGCPAASCAPTRSRRPVLRPRPDSGQRAAERDCQSVRETVLSHARCRRRWALPVG